MYIYIYISIFYFFVLLIVKMIMTMIIAHLYGFSNDIYRVTGSQVVLEWKNSCNTEAFENAMLDLHNQILLAKVVV